MPRLVLGYIDAQDLARFVPVKNDFADVRALVQFAGQVDGVLAHLIDVLAADPVLDRPTDRRAHFQRLYIAADTDEILAQPLAQPLAELRARLEVLADDHQLRIEGVLQLLVEWQVETNRALADVRAPAHDIRIALEGRLQAVNGLAGFIQRGVLRQVQVDENFRAIGRGEELVLHKAHGKHRQHEAQHGDTDGPPAIAHAPE
ncbi:hypothetical protein D3C78_1095400 [compost metagenome]